MDLMDLLNKLPFHKISENFVECTINNEFSEYQKLQDVPLDKESVFEQIKTLNRSLRQYFQDNEALRNWRQIIEQDNFQYRKCLCLIFHLIHCGQSKHEACYKLVFETSSLYLLLISLPLSGPMNVFHQNLYLKCIEAIQLCSAERKLGYAVIKSKHSVVDFLKNMMIAFKHFNLKDTYSLDNTMRCLVSTVVDLNSQAQELSSPIYETISCLCDYYNTDDALFSAVKYASPLLSMSELSNLNAAEQAMNLKSFTQFIIKLMEKVGERMSDIILKLVMRFTILCAETSALADLRRKRCNVVTALAHSLPPGRYDDYMKWFAQFTSSTKKQHRLFAQHVILQLLPTEASTSSASATVEMAVDGAAAAASSYSEDANRVGHIAESHRRVLLIIIDRCYDTHDDVATKALQNLSEAFRIPHMNDLLMHMFDPEAPVYSSVDTSGLPTADEMSRMLLYYLREDKISLRKAALLLLEHIAVNKPRQWLNKTLQQQLVLMVRDTSASVRQQALSVLTQFVTRYMTEDSALIGLWCENVLPEAPNTASGLDNRIYTEFGKLFLDNLVPFQNVSAQPISEIPWSILSYIRIHEWRQYLEDAMEYWHTKKILRSTVVATVQTYINTKYNLDALMFLASLSKLIKLQDVSFAVDWYHQYMRLPNTIKETEGPGASMHYVLEILRSPHGMSGEARYALSDSLIRHLTTWSVPVHLATDFMNAITALQKTTGWREHYIEIACDTVKDGLSALQDDAPSFDSLRFELALLLYVENPSGIRKLPFRELAVRLCHKIDSNEQPMIVRFHRQPTLYKTMVVSLARICLRDDEVALSAVPLFARILDRNANVDVKLLCLIILKDMCTLYTRLVEPHTDAMLLCLKAEPRVRPMAVRVLTELQADGYLKLRGDRLVCYLSAVLDDQPEVRSVIDYYITQKAASQNKDLMLNLLVDVVYFHNNKSSSESLANAFSCHGDEMALTRHDLYRYMVFNIKDDAKYKLIRMLYANILEPWSNDSESTDAIEHDELSILRDVLAILSLKDLKPQSIEAAGRNTEDGADADSSMEMEVDGAEDMAADKSKMATIEMMVPILTKIKARLSHDSLEPDGTLKSLFNSYVDELHADYKKQIKKLDPQFVKKVFGK